MSDNVKRRGRPPKTTEIVEENNQDIIIKQLMAAESVPKAQR